jgi:pantoate--beta-alanine ligase
MGALHDGHAALIRKARQVAGRTGTVIVSIFVNPTQFGPGEDFAAYPRPISRDLLFCRMSGADAVFAPSAGGMYSSDASVSVDEELLSKTLCGRSRPGHFRGVCTVVAKLFLITEPTHAVFGEKDWQQLAIIRRMVRDLNFSVRILGHPTVREEDGLARSSRNAYLTASEREVAPLIHRALVEAAGAGLSPVGTVRRAESAIRRIPGARVDYVEAVEAASLARLPGRKVPGRLAAAVFLGRARLIDNVAMGVIR